MVYEDKARFDALALRIKNEEGLRLKAYKPDTSEEKYTIGYGHYGVNEGDEITEEEAENLFRNDLNSRLVQINKRIPNFVNLKPELQDSIVSSWFRGSISGSPKTIKLINEGKYKEAASEFLNNKEYTTRKSRMKGVDVGVVARMERLSKALVDQFTPQSGLPDIDVNDFINDIFTLESRDEFVTLNEQDIERASQDMSDEEANSGELVSDTRDITNYKLSFTEKLAAIGSLDTQGSHLRENIDAILDDKPLDFVPQTTKNTPILAEVQPDHPVQMSDIGPVDISEEPNLPDEDEFTYSSGISLNELGGQSEPVPTTFAQDLSNFSIDDMGDDLINKFIDRNAIGFLTQGAIRALTMDRVVDPNFDIEKGIAKEVYTELTAGLPAEEIADILDTAYSQGDFIRAASLAQGREKRKKEMQSYANKHPVLSGVNSVGSMLVEGAAFMPVSSILGAAMGSIKIKTLADITKLKYGSAIIGETLEQGLQEIIWAKGDKEYEFDPLIFASGLGIGVGLKLTVGTKEADVAFRKLMREVLESEDGFIRIATSEGKKLVDEVAKNVTDNKAVALAAKVTKKKTKVANEIRADLFARRSAMKRKLANLEKRIKEVKEPKMLKKLKGQKQKLVRQMEKFDKKLPNEMMMLMRGDHPKLQADVNPEFKLSNIAKEIGIDPKEINTPEKLRKFLGLDQPDVDPDFVIEGEKTYTKVVREQLREMSTNKRLNMNETLRYLAGTDTVRTIDELPILGKLQIGDKLLQLAEADGPISQYLFNKGNLVSSDNELVASFYNWLAPDGMGRQGMSKIRAIESQQKYANIYGGELMNIYHTHGSTIYDSIKGKFGRVKGFFSPDDYEEVVEPILKERLLSADATAFRQKYGDAIADAADNFYKDFNNLNKKIVSRMKELGVEGVNFDATDGWFHRSWDFRKARAVAQTDLEDTIFRAMKSHAEKLGVKDIDLAELQAHAKRFAYGLKNADITKIEGMQSDHIKLLEKLLRKAEGIETEVINDELARLKMLKAKADAGDLANRVQMDVDVKLADGRPLSDLFEDNIIHTQKRYTSRMSARIAAAEHGVKNIDILDEWIDDAVKDEIKRQAAKGVKNPQGKAEYIEKAMKQDLLAFKHGGMVGIHDLPDDTASDLVRFVKKYNYARLMQYTGISSIAELGGTFVEAGVSTTLGEMARYMRNHFNDLFLDNPDKYTGRLYDELRSITGVGMEDFSFTSKGMSKATRIFDNGILNKAEKAVDVLGRTAQAPFGGIEKVGRRITANSLAIKWGNHFNGTESGGLLSAFFGSNGVTNRVLENSGFGIIDNTGKFIPNKTYKDIQASFKKFAKFDDKGRLLKLNLDQWDTKTAQAFGDAIQMQVNHIMVSPDSTTMALWQSTTIGQILNQFRTFTVNATTKVMGQTVANAAISANRGDMAEAIKAGQKIFWGTSLGMLSVTIRQGIQRAGGDQEVDLFDEGLIKAAAIGFSRSSVAGNLPTIGDSISGSFGFDPIFDKTSTVGRSKNFFNLATTPTGQAVGGFVDAGQKTLQGDFKGSGMQLLKSSPVYRQIGVQQIFNFVDDEK